MVVATDLLQIYRGDTWSKKINITNPDGSVFNLTGYTWIFTAKLNGVSVISASGACDDDPTTGIQPVTLSSVETDVAISNRYDYDIQIANTDTPPIVYTVAKSRLAILQDITT